MSNTSIMSVGQIKHLSLMSLFIAISMIHSSSFLAAEWPQFRGPTGEGHVAAKLPTTWSGRTVKWRSEIPGRGWSSPVITGEHVWVTTAVERNATDAEKAELEKTIDPKYVKQRSYLGKVDFKALCYHANTGELIKDILLTSLATPAPVHKTNSYASPTPIINDGRLYCHFGAYGTWCLEEATGKQLWHKQIDVNFSVGPGSSPVIVDDLLILVCDGIDAQFMVGLNKLDGKQVWRTNRPPMDKAKTDEHKKSFSTPLLVNWEGKQQVIVPTAMWLTSYDPKSGKELWRYFHGDGFSIVPRPVFQDGIVYFSTGFGRATMHAVKVNGSGDITKTHQKWVYSRSVSRLSSFIIVGEAIYQVDGKGVATCLDLKTGKVIWTKRLNGQFTASPVASNGLIYFSNKSGETHIVKAGKTFKVLHTNKVAGEFHASPAVIDNSLVLRTTEGLYRVD